MPLGGSGGSVPSWVRQTPRWIDPRFWCPFVSTHFRLTRAAPAHCFCTVSPTVPRNVCVPHASTGSTADAVWDLQWVQRWLKTVEFNTIFAQISTSFLTRKMFCLFVWYICPPQLIFILKVLFLPLRWKFLYFYYFFFSRLDYSTCTPPKCLYAAFIFTYVQHILDYKFSCLVLFKSVKTCLCS